MNYYRHGWILVLIGTFFFAIGGLIATYGWNIWSHRSEKEKYLREGAWDIMRGTIIIALAGLLTTHGWNVIKLGEQRSNLIQAITQEWILNITRLGSSPMEGEIYYVKEDGEYVWRPFPTLRTNAMNAILSSGFWNYGNQMDRKFLDVVEDYEKRAITANRKFRSYDDFFSKIQDPNERIMQTKKVRGLTYEKDWFKSLKNTQNQVGKLVWSKYRWAITKQLPEASELFQQRFQEKPPASEPEKGLLKENTE